MDNLAPEIKWRGSTYVLESVNEDAGKVHWVNPVSRHKQSCTIESWKQSDPYDGHYNER